MLRIIYMGTPQFAVPALEALQKASAPGVLLGEGYEIVTVITRPDKPAGRGREIVFSPVKQSALAASLPVWQPGSFKKAENSEALARYKLPGNRLELEVTEGVFLGDSGATLDVLKRLRTLGVGIALDDFGTGYSSIGYLNKAVFHKLKIDGSFVREAGTRPENVAIIQSIVQLAKSFRMSITAEGVETAEDFERMRDLGCDIIQGYLFGKPLPYERANQMVLGLGAKRMAG